jgi:hypothetical protein
VKLRQINLLRQIDTIPWFFVEIRNVCDFLKYEISTQGCLILGFKFSGEGTFNLRTPIGEPIANNCTGLDYKYVKVYMFLPFETTCSTLARPSHNDNFNHILSAATHGISKASSVCFIT